MIELFERALKQTYISVNDAKRFDATQLQQLIVSDSINGSKPQSLFNVNESIFARIRLQDNTISHEDYNQLTPIQKQELISKGVYPSNDAPNGILSNMPYITRSDFEQMSPGDRQKVMRDKIAIKEGEPTKELNIPNLINALQRQDAPEDVKED